MNLFQQFEDTTGGTSGIDIEAAVADFSNPGRDENSNLIPNQVSAERSNMNNEYYDE